MKHTAVGIAVLISALAGSGCSSPPAQRPPEQPPAAVTEPPSPESVDPVTDALARANRSDPAGRSALLLDAAGMLLQRKEYVRVISVLGEGDFSSAGPEERARRALLLADALAGTGETARALELLGAAGGSVEAPLPRALEVELRDARARLLLALDRPLDSAVARAELQPWITDDSARATNLRQILDALGHVPLGELDRIAAQSGSDEWRSWVELSVIAREMRRPPMQQRKALQDWQQRFGGSSTSASAVSALLERTNASIADPRRVALLLPLTGRAASSGQAVLQGYLAGYYSDMASGESVPALAIVDTAGTPEGFADAYRKTSGDGAEVVIGPLLKEELAAFSSGLIARVPTLALNFLDDSTTPIPGVRQFGIDLSDEVSQLTTDARRTGMARAIVLADGSPRARRLVDEFGKQWRDSGGELVDTLYLGDLNEYRLNLEQTLLLDRSADRSAAISQLTGLELQIEPRRRMDVDVVVLLAEPAGARSIRALLPFLYAGDIPARAISMSYAAGSGQGSDFDLESMRLLDMPWFSGSEEPVRAVAAVRRGPFERLVALGVDAERLQSRLGLLDNCPEWSLGGATGEVSAGEDGRLRRRTTWFVIDAGEAKPELQRASLPGQTPTEGTQAWTPAEEAPAHTPEDRQKTER